MDVPTPEQTPAGCAMQLVAFFLIGFFLASGVLVAAALFGR